jgi:hypothetical protein
MRQAWLAPLLVVGMLGCARLPTPLLEAHPSPIHVGAREPPLVLETSGPRPAWLDAGARDTSTDRLRFVAEGRGAAPIEACAGARLELAFLVDLHLGRRLRASFTSESRSDDGVESETARVEHHADPFAPPEPVPSEAEHWTRVRGPDGPEVRCTVGTRLDTERLELRRRRRNLDRAQRPGQPRLVLVAPERGRARVAARSLGRAIEARGWQVAEARDTAEADALLLGAVGGRRLLISEAGAGLRVGTGAGPALELEPPPLDPAAEPQWLRASFARLATLESLR